jgi:fatty-acyl-CoA synthase
MAAFDGYTDATASQRKILRDVFTPGDAWFRTGDLMWRDASGFFYFVDRTGDTFRWKGENVSTAQVADVVNSCRGVKQAVVYGVPAAQADGKLGMAALVVDADFSWLTFRDHLAANLPEFAHPLVVRLCTTLPMTGTFKPMTAQLAAEGFDPDRTTDSLYVSDRTCNSFVPLDRTRYGAIVRGDMRV